MSKYDNIRKRVEVNGYSMWEYSMTPAQFQKVNLMTRKWMFRNMKTIPFGGNVEELYRGLGYEFHA